MNTNRPPKRVLLVILLLALIEPSTHLATLYFPPDGAVPTGMHIGDSAHHLLAMRSFWNGFFSPFATCHAPYGPKHFRYFATPFFLMYGAVGAIGHALHINEFLYLGLVNGLGGALYLFMAYRLLRVITPQRANRAFFLFTLGGGLGGVLYIITGLLGLHDHPQFEENFMRFAWSDLIEGQQLSPWLLMPRLYYTLPMALGLAALTCFFCDEQSWKTSVPCPKLLIPTSLLALATALNLRLGPMLWAIAALYLAAGLSRPQTHLPPSPDSPEDAPLKSPFEEEFGRMLLCFRSLRRCPTSHPPVVPLQRGTEDPPFRIACPRPRRASFALALAVPVVIGGAAGAAVLHLHPSYTENVAAVTQGVMRLLPFLSVTVFFWIAAFPAIRAAIAALSPPYRTAALAAAGYLLAYLILFLGYQAYYGNWLRGGDSTAPIVISDPALVGAALGLFYGLLTWHKARPAPPETDSPAWAVLWLLAFLTLALGAFGHGWFQRFTPQRFMILLGLPLAILAAHGLDAMRPALRRALYTAILACGIISILVASLFFQGSWGRTPGHGPFAYLHYNFMTQADADLLEHLTPGIIAVPMWSPIAFGEIISLRPGARVLGGPGAMNLGDQPFGQIEKAAKTFFSPDTPDVLRRSFARDWCVDYVYWPDTCPLDPRVLEELLATPWLELLAHAGHGAIFRVQKKLLSPGTCEI